MTFPSGFAHKLNRLSICIRGYTALPIGNDQDGNLHLDKNIDLITQEDKYFVSEKSAGRHNQRIAIPYMHLNL